ncbi:hypothetical protein F4810DRAFT_654767 [Camillea tinctor]|nr:hypothetical protein F4810DRAFT_654767 [Camillea tinctor]
MAVYSGDQTYPLRYMLTSVYNVLSLTVLVPFFCPSQVCTLVTEVGMLLLVLTPLSLSLSVSLSSEFVSTRVAHVVF